MRIANKRKTNANIIKKYDYHCTNQPQQTLLQSFGICKSAEEDEDKNLSDEEHGS